MSLLFWQLNNPDAATKSGGADYFSADFISRAADPWGEALSLRVYLRLNDGASGAPGTLVEFDKDGYEVVGLGRINRRREREYGVVQGQAWQVKVYNKDRGLLDYDLPGCWCCVQAGFSDDDVWQTFAQGKVANVQFGTDDTATFEVHDGVIDLLNYSLANDVYFDFYGHGGTLSPYSVATASGSYDTDAGGIDVNGVMWVYLEDEKFVVEFTSAYQFKVVLEDGTETQTGDVFHDLTVANQDGYSVVILRAAGWDTSTLYTAGDQFVFYTSAARQGVGTTPVQVVREVVTDFVGLQVYDVISGAYYGSPFFNETAWSEATAATSEPLNSVENTYSLRGEWPRGSRAIDMVQDALKLVNGSIYSTPTGQIGIWLLRPSAGAAVALNGDPAAGPVEIISASINDTLDDTYNAVSLTYKTGNGEDATYDAVDSDPSISETRTAAIRSGWRVRGEVAQSAANIFLNRFKDRRREYVIDATLAGALCDVAYGVSVNEPDLGVTVETTDVTEISVDLGGHVVQIKAHTDPVALTSYARVGDATTDPGGSQVGSTDRVW